MRVPAFNLKDYPLRWAFANGLICFIALNLTFAAFVHNFFGGMAHGTFLVADHWGITQAEKEADWLPVYSYGTGWDGQFYFRQATDPFLLTDSITVSDNVSYRYQRNGVPLLAWCAAQLVGQYPTTGSTFHLTQFLLIGIGFGYLCYWLAVNGQPWWYSLAWLFCGGMFALFRGLPDSAADALFIVSLFAASTQHLKTYCLATVALLLCREGYAIYAAIIFAMSCLNYITWPNSSRIRSAILTATPGVVVVGWACYVAYRLGKRPLSGAGQVSFGFLVDWPFHAYYRAMTEQFYTHANRELLLKTLCAVTLLIVLINLFRSLPKWRLAWALIPYVVLIAMTGITIWETENGYPKALSAVLIIAIFQLKERRSFVIPVVLMLHLLFGIQMAYHFNYRYQQYLHQDFVTAEVQLKLESPPPEIPTPESPENVSFENFPYVMEGRRVENKRGPYRGIFRPIHRDPFVLIATATNTSDKTWYVQPPGAPNSLSIAWQLISSTGQVKTYYRAYLSRNIAPGDSFSCVVPVPTPSKKGEYELVVSMTQTPEKFFSEMHAGTPLREKILVE